jgi:trehalose-phosphatase
VIGVARKNNETELLDNGADVVVRDLADLDREWLRRWFERTPRSFFESWESLSGSFLGIAPNDDSGMIVHPLYYRDARGALFRKERLAIFLDYDGTLTPIVQRPQDAVMSEDMRSSVSALSRWHRVGIVSGRMREDVENLVKIPELLFAGSHGFDIRGPDMELLQPKARETLPLVARITEQLKEQVKDIPGALIEEKKFSVAVHYRLVEEDRYLDRIREYVDSIVSAHSGQLKLLHGKKVLEILPDMEWDKGKAIRWVMNALGLEWNETSVVYIGDDVTDEFAFRTITTRGTAILVSDESRHSAADFRVSSVKEVKKIFEKIIETSTKQ